MTAQARPQRAYFQVLQPFGQPANIRNYSPPLIASGAHSEVRVGNKVVLKRPRQDTYYWHHGIRGDLKEHAALKAAGVRVPQIKGRVLKSRQWLILEKARPVTEADLERHAGELASIMSHLLKARIDIELNRINLGICKDKKGRERLVVLDFVQSLFFDPDQALQGWTNPKRWKFQNPARSAAFTQRLQKELTRRGVALPHS